MSLPVVAIIGAPNAGKSTLFNRMLGRRKAIVSETPGVTRDRIAAECDLDGSRITLVDTGGMITPQSDDITRGVRAEAMKAIKEADLVLFLIDARAGLTSTVEEVAASLRASGKPIIPVANKIDAASLEGMEVDLYRLGMGEVLPISAEQGRGINELIDRIRTTLPAWREAARVEGVPLAIVGRPNVGKSSLFNRIVRQERALVSPVPGTTRDPVDSTFTRGGILYRILDTAGIRRRVSRAEDVEWVSVLKAHQAIEAAEIVIAMVDGATGVEHQDLAILGLVSKARIPVVLAVNKVDLLPGLGLSESKRLEEIRAALRFARHVPVVGISALRGQGVDELLDAVGRLKEEIGRRFSTSELNRALGDLLRERQPPADAGKEVRLLYLTQVGGTPPRFVVFGNGRRVNASYRRFMEGRLRARLGLTAAPLILGFKRGRPSR